MKERFVIATIIFFVLVLFETSFLSSLPDWGAYIPLMLVVGTYLIQRYESWIGALYLIAYGVLLDLTGLYMVPFETLSYGAAAAVAWVVARSVVTRRSYYGLLLCGVAAYFTLFTLHATLQATRWLLAPSRVSWEIFWDMSLRQGVVYLVLLILIFPALRKADDGLRRLYQTKRSA